MRYTMLGHSGLRVSELCLGTMTFGPEWGWGADRAESRRMFEVFAHAGGNFVDTADAYTDGTSEELVGELIRHERDEFVVATKYSMTKRPDLCRSGNSRKNMVRSVEDSLRRLDTDYIDLYYLHFWDSTTEIDEVMRAFDDLVSAGKVLYVGLSNTPAWLVAQADTIAELRGWAPVAAIQVEYSLAQRTAERELLPMARALGLGVTAWSPLAGGVLSGTYLEPTSADGAAVPAPRRLEGAPVDPDHLRVAAAVRSVADAIGAAPAQVALSWLRQHDAWPPIIPVLGARSAAQLRENLACVDTALDADAMAALSRATDIELGFPHDVLRDERSRWHATGGHHALLDGHRRVRAGVSPQEGR